jgi:hypothetical protein
MSFSYTPAKAAIACGEIAFDSADIRLLLVMSDTTADTDEDAATIDAITTLDEYDGDAYVRKAFAGETVTEDDTNDRAEFSADPVTWTALGVGTRQAVGMVIFLFVTNDTDSIPIAYVDTGGFPFDGNGLDVLMTPNAEGLIQLT